MFWWPCPYLQGLCVTKKVKSYAKQKRSCIARFLLPCRLTSCDKAKPILLKGRLVDCNKSGYSALSVIIHQATHGNIRCATLCENPYISIGRPVGSKKLNNRHIISRTKIFLTRFTMINL